jgi:hypothetical protein
MRLSHILIVTCILAAASTVTFAQQQFFDPPMSKQGPAAGDAESPLSLPSLLREMLAKESTTRDPTQPSRPLRQAIDVATTTPSSANPGAMPSYPRFSIKARVVGQNAPPMALLTVDDKITMAVQAGQTYRVPQAGGSTYQVKVRDISSTAVELDLLPVNIPMLLH